MKVIFLILLGLLITMGLFVYADTIDVSNQKFGLICIDVDTVDGKEIFNVKQIDYVLTEKEKYIIDMMRLTGTEDIVYDFLIQFDSTELK